MNTTHKPTRVIVFVDRGFVWSAIADTNIEVITVNVDKQVIHRNNVLINEKECDHYQELANELERCGMHMDVVAGKKVCAIADVIINRRKTS